jgi:von Willebrand factor type A domain.
MWQLEYPWLLFLLPLPWLAWRYLPAYRESRSALRVPFFAAMSHAAGQEPDRGGTSGGRWQLPLNLLVWALLLVACARPVLVEKPIERVQPIRDLMLAIDISQSMETSDYLDAGGNRTDRLSVVKGVVRDFINERQGDRIGLIVFGTGAFAQSPPTLDHASLLMLLDEVGIGMAGPNTALGDAIGLTLKLLEKTSEQEKVLILLTDGNDTGSAISPGHAASLAHERGVWCIPSVSATPMPAVNRRWTSRPCRTLPGPPAGASSAPATARRCGRSTPRWTRSPRTR